MITSLKLVIVVEKGSSAVKWEYTGWTKRFALFFIWNSKV